MSHDLSSAHKMRDMLHSTIAQRRARDFSERSEMPMKYSFSMRLTFCELAES
jgi:hypothetical protein